MKKEPQYINSVCRAVEIIELFSKLNEKELGVSEISKQLGIHKTTIFRILKTLEHVGWIAQNSENSKYQLTTGILKASIGVRQNFNLKEIISREMEKLSKKYNENIILTTIVDKIGVWINMIKSTQILSEDVEAGYSVPLHIGATGKTLLAFQSDEFQKEFFRNHSTLIDETLGKRKLSAQLKKIKKERFCISDSEVTEGVIAVSVPILDDTGKLLYGLTISGPGTRFNSTVQLSMKEDLLGISHYIENELRTLRSKL